MMRILVTGLCLSRNLGGPAMALTLWNQLIRRYPDAEVWFAVSAPDWDEERKWAAYYGVNVCPRITILQHIRGNRMVQGLKALLRRPTGRDAIAWKSVAREFRESMTRCDAVVCMEGISYVGDGAWNWRSALDNFSYYRLARMLRKPYSRFIQSYGPFDDRLVRWIARRELSRLPFVFARGRHAAESCRRLLPRVQIHNVPDIAILLPSAPSSWGEAYLAHRGLISGQYTVLAPSAVIANTVDCHKGTACGEKYVECLQLITDRLLAKGESVLMLPHMYSPNPIECDRAVAHRVCVGVRTAGSLHIIEDDLDVFQAKYLLANARQCVVSRYHALVGAISSGAPAVALGWNIKYRDFLEFYELGDMALDARLLSPVDGAGTTLRLLEGYTSERVGKMRAAQLHNEKIVMEAFEGLFRWLNDEIG